MVVQTIIIDDKGKKVVRTHRDFNEQLGMAELREGFYAQQQSARSGEMYQLKGKERILMAQFGNTNNSDEGRFDEGEPTWGEEGAE